MVELYVKAPAERTAIEARYKLKASHSVSGIEVLLSPTDIERKYAAIEDALKYGAKRFDGKINICISPSFGQDVNLNVTSGNKPIRERARKVLYDVLKLATKLQLKGVVTLHPEINYHEEHVKEGTYRINRDDWAAHGFGHFINLVGIKYDRRILPVNTYANISQKSVISYSEGGIFLSDFTKEIINAPMTLNIAHFGILMHYYALADNLNTALVQKIRLLLPEEGECWRDTLVEEGYTATLLELLELYKRKIQIENVHFGNAGKGFGTDSAHCLSTSERIGLFDLGKVTKAVVKLKPNYIVPEVDVVADNQNNLRYSKNLLKLISENL